MPSFILRDTKLQGNLTQKDSITIDGLLLGDIKSQEIIVTENGNVTGDLTAELNIEKSEDKLMEIFLRIGSI
jgi:cytoskeletal protein CcmA (bactofilin family)